jgi:hypothetical protein
VTTLLAFRQVPTDFADDIVPLFVVEGQPAQPLAFVGTGFLLKPGVLVTCWHCVRDQLSAGQNYAAIKEVDGVWKALHLVNLGQDANGSDLATAMVALRPRLEFGLGEPVLAGTDVVTVGYPLTESPTELRPSFHLAPRLLKGYVTRTFGFESPSFGTIPSYELDMPAPGGLSGAPVIPHGSKDVVGVVHGAYGAELIEHYSTIDETGTRVPEIRKVFSFGLAHHTETLRALSGPATFGLPLHEFVSIPTN